MIRNAQPSDADAIARIYNHYILNTVVTFEEQVLDATQICTRIEATIAAGLPWLVAEREGQVIGYAYASKWIGRCAYRYSVECTVYLDCENIAQGVGSRLYQALFNILRGMEMHTLIAGIVLPNPASVALHQKFGFSKVAHFSQVGFKFDQWLDVGYWQMLL